jgi:hypothetical protein
MRNISRRDALVAAVALVATKTCDADAAPGSAVACDVWTSSLGDCQTPAHFKYADLGRMMPHGRDEHPTC